MKAPAAPIGRRLVPAAAAAAVVAALSGGAWYGFDYISSQPIRRVVFAGDVAKIARADLEAFARGVQATPPGGASLESVREAARRIPWVREATVRRLFPDAVEVTFETHEALARRDDGTLVSVRGEVFAAESDAPLPRFRGPESSAATMAREYPAIARTVGPLGLGVKELRLTARGAWQVVLEQPADRTLPSPGPSPKAEGHLLVDLGRGDIQPRLARFARAWGELSPEARATRRADLRYANGFALERAAPPPATPQKK